VSPPVFILGYYIPYVEVPIVTFVQMPYPYFLNTFCRAVLIA